MNSIFTRAQSEFDSAPIRTAYYAAGLIAALCGVMLAIIAYRNVLTVYVLPIAFTGVSVFIVLRVLRHNSLASHLLGIGWLVALMSAFAMVQSMTFALLTRANLIRLLQETNTLSTDASIRIASKFVYTLPWRLYSVLSFVALSAALLSLMRNLHQVRLLVPDRVDDNTSSENHGSAQEQH